MGWGRAQRLRRCTLSKAGDTCCVIPVRFASLGPRIDAGKSASKGSKARPPSHPPTSGHADGALGQKRGAARAQLLVQHDLPSRCRRPGDALAHIAGRQGQPLAQLAEREAAGCAGAAPLLFLLVVHLQGWVLGLLLESVFLHSPQSRTELASGKGRNTDTVENLEFSVSRCKSSEAAGLDRDMRSRGHAVLPAIAVPSTSQSSSECVESE